MTIDHKIKDEKLQYYIHREAGNYHQVKVINMNTLQVNIALQK